ncbi:glycosyltransferase family 4 protein [Candidatus Nomurabacteria bacterium]|nr:glycosyltransferase family 4 protein [Candidatus Nomurabacteria bacterium]
MFKIALEASRANKSHKTGTEWYAWHLLQEFKKIDQINQFIIYYHQDLAEALTQNAPANFIFRKLNWPFKKFWTHFRLSWQLLRQKPDKFFASNSLPLLTRGQAIVTIHDLGFYKNPELYHFLERWYQKISHYLSIKRADKIIAVSENTAQDIRKYFPKAKNKIQVIYNGWNQEEFKMIDSVERENILDKYDLPEKFILYIGRIETKKNIQNLLKAFALLKNKDYHLVLAGRPGNFGYQEILDLSKKAEIKDRVHLIGYIRQQDYAKLLACANLFVFPSKFEGFGIPVLEAMGSAVPTVISDLGVLREIANNASVYFDPERAEDMAQKIDAVLADDVLQKELIEKGLKQCAKFSWSKCARETLAYILK